jgi:hypothetical protein
VAGKVRPAPWVTLDIFYLGRASIRSLGTDFGPAGPLVFLQIIGEAKQAAMSGAPPDKQGIVRIGYRSLAQTAFLENDSDLVKRIVAACVEEELIELLPESTEKRLVARLAKWSEWEPRDSGGAQRQHRHNHQDDPDAGLPF